MSIVDSFACRLSTMWHASASGPLAALGTRGGVVSCRSLTEHGGSGHADYGGHTSRAQFDSNHAGDWMGEMLEAPVDWLTTSRRLAVPEAPVNSPRVISPMCEELPWVSSPAAL